MTGIPFEETQRLPAYIFLIVMAVFAAIGAFVRWRTPATKRRSATWVLAGSAIFTVAMLLAMKMQTRVTEDAVEISLFFVLERRIALGEIASVEAVEYRPLQDFGGWGLRFGAGGKAYSVSGNQGVRLTLQNGEAVTVGSQRPDELSRAITDARARLPS
ncbi:MAG: hypothetical protein AAF415_07105 [Pseudomonadota bacterium]